MGILEGDLTANIAGFDDPNLPSSVYGRDLWRLDDNSILSYELQGMDLSESENQDLDDMCIETDTHPDGHAEGGRQSDTYRAYSPSPLDPSDAWEEGLQAIEDFDWDKPVVAEVAECPPKAGTLQRESAQAFDEQEIRSKPSLDLSLFPVSVAAANSREQVQKVRNAACLEDAKLTVLQLQSKGRISHPAASRADKFDTTAASECEDREVEQHLSEGVMQVDGNSIPVYVPSLFS